MNGGREASGTMTMKTRSRWLVGEVVERGMVLRSLFFLMGCGGQLVTFLKRLFSQSQKCLLFEKESVHVNLCDFCKVLP